MVVDLRNLFYFFNPVLVTVGQCPLLFRIFYYSQFILCLSMHDRLPGERPLQDGLCQYRRGLHRICSPQNPRRPGDDGLGAVDRCGKVKGQVTFPFLTQRDAAGRTAQGQDKLPQANLAQSSSGGFIMLSSNGAGK